jgi:hypothetical protein
MTVRLLICAWLVAGCVALLGCPATTTTPTLPPTEWQMISIDYGQGHYRFPARYHWVAVRAENGVIIKSPDGGDAMIRLFACAETVKQVQGRIRRQLRDRFIGSDFETAQGAYTFSWRQGKVMTGDVMFTGIAQHGLLLVTVTSGSMQPDDVLRLAAGTRLDLPLPSIQSCLPVCLPKAHEKCEQEMIEE